jgi:hypothetical protein
MKDLYGCCKVSVEICRLLSDRVAIISAALGAAKLSAERKLLPQADRSTKGNEGEASKRMEEWENKDMEPVLPFEKLCP